MPPLKNPRWEVYAQGRAKGLSSHDAHTAAGYKPNRHNAAVFNTNETIIARVMEIQGNTQNRLVLSKTYVIDALLENAEKALGRRPVKITRRVKTGDDEYVDEIAEVYVYKGDVANAAIKMAGSEMGLFVDRKDIRISNGMEKMTDEELAHELTRTAQLLLESPGKVIEHEPGDDT